VLRGKKEKKKRRNNSQFQQTKMDSTGAEAAQIATIQMAQGSTQLKHDQGSPLSGLFVLRGGNMKKHQKNSQF
jgi:hypothetical protein